MAASNIEEAIHTKYTASTDVHDEVGDRVYWVQAPQKATIPYVTYFVVSDPHESHSFDKSTSGNPRVQFNVYDDTPIDARTAAEVMRDELDKYSGTADSVEIIVARCGGVVTEKMPDEENMYRARFDAEIIYVDP
jgi:hypothetical protein